MNRASARLAYDNMECALVPVEKSAGSDVVAKTLEMLAGLKQPSGGGGVYEQLVQAMSEYQQLKLKVHQTYDALLHLLLEANARNPVFEPAAPPNISVQLELLRDSSSGVSAETVDHIVPISLGSSSIAGSQPVLAVSGGHPMWMDIPGVAPREEHLTDTAYRLHLDRQRDEIEKLQETLSQSIREAISQNQEFGALLRAELRAFKQAASPYEVEQLRNILVGGIEELIKGQHLLETKLNQTGSYLNLIKADSQRLRDELYKVRLLSMTDEFTGLPNRRAFMRRLQDEISRAQRYSTPLALALIDLDGFKAVNDVYGHGGGDEVLRCYASQVLSVLRHHDMVARYGGEEFAVVLPNTTEAGAMAAINKARQRSHETFWRFADKSIKLPTFSAGIAMYQEGELPTELIERADRALYSAKSLGRNRLEVAPAAPPVAIDTPVAADPEPQKSG